MHPRPDPPVPTGQQPLPLIPFSVFTEYGHSVNLSLSVTTTFAEIKVLFEERLGIPRSWQSFYSHWDASPSNTRFADSETLLDFLATLRGLPPDWDGWLRDTSPLQIRFRHGELCVSSPTSRCDRLQLHLFPVRDSVLDVKERIQATRSIPVARQRLLFEGRDLPDDLAIVDLPGESRDHGYSIIRLVVRAVEPIRIQIQARDGRSISLTVRTSDLVSEIKAQIQENEAIPIDEQHLFLGSDELGNQFILGDYPIREGRRIANDFTLHLRVPGDEARAPGPQSSGGSGIEIRINDLDDGTISSVRVRPTDRISVVAPLAEWDSSKVCKRAWLGGVMLDPEMTFADYRDSIGIETALHLDFRMKIDVRTLAGQRMAFFVQPRDRIEDLKVWIHARIGTPPVGQRLVFAGRQLEGGNSLEEYHIGPGSLVSMLLRLRG